MFGYVRYDFPNLFVKDAVLYRAIYCGLCKGIARSCGQTARLGLSYDVAFLSAIFHNIKGIDFVVKPCNCFEHAVKKRPIAEVDPLTEELGALNTVLCYYKLGDDVEDSGKRRGTRLLFKKGFRRAEKKYPELVALIRDFMERQADVERQKVSSLDMAADPTATMLQALSDHFLSDMATPFTRNLFYSLGKWVYLIDALDDYDGDVRSGAYNPFALSYGAPSREVLLRERGEEISFLFDTVFYAMRENLSGIPFKFNRDLTDNVILRGIPIETRRVFKGEPPPQMSLKF